MHQVRRRRLMVVLFVFFLSSIAVVLLVFALRENLHLFYPPVKMANGSAPLEQLIRGGGCVVPGSVVRSSQDLSVRFRITDGTAEVPVSYTGILPDLFAEGEAAVVRGRLTAQGEFQAVEVLAKHDETYTPVEVEDAIASSTHQATCQDVTPVN